MSPDYVADWTVTDAIRELFQNALDQETMQSDNEMFFEVEGIKDSENCKISIGNKSSILDVQTLLLGSTTKKDSKETIGKFGEGYKIATLVLLRAGKEITFYNYGAREVWKPRFVNSRRYGGVKILVFDVEKSYFWTKVPDNNLTIEITGITKEELEGITESTLRLQTYYKSISTDYGDILLDERHKGKIFVNGLYISKFENYAQGYNLKPQYVKLDRDRRMLNTFELEWLISRMWLNKEIPALTVIEVAKNAPEAKYISSHTYYARSDVSTGAYLDFVERYGSKAIPISNNEELQKYKNTDYDVVMVSEQEKELITRASDYEEPELEATPKERLEEWFNNVIHKLSDEEVEEFNYLFERLK